MDEHLYPVLSHSSDDLT